MVDTQRHTGDPVARAVTNPSMHDVAAAAGVSIGTVSNVLNHPHKVAEPTTEKVRSAIAQLGFVRNSAAHLLAAGRSTSVGLILTDITNSLFVDLARAAQVAADEAGFKILLANSDTNYQQQEAYLDLFDEARVAGILLAPMEDSRAGIERVRSHGRQVVLLNFVSDPEICCAVLMDNVHAGYIAAKHLIDIGRRRLAFVGPDSLQPVHDRLVGARRAVEETAGRVSLDEYESDAVSTSEGRRIGNAILFLDADDRPDGVVAGEDQLATGLVQAFDPPFGLRVPEQVAVIGCDNNRITWDGPMPLSTVTPPAREMGTEAIRLLVEEITSDPAGHQHRSVAFKPGLLLRESTVGRRR